MHILSKAHFICFYYIVWIYFIKSVSDFNSKNTSFLYPLFLFTLTLPMFHHVCQLLIPHRVGGGRNEGLYHINCHSPTQPQHELELDLIMGRKPPPPTQELSLLLLLLAAPASQAGNTVQLYSQSTVQPLCTTSLDFKVYLMIGF